jgi:transcriptional regulator with XRE-family HTH domain
MAKNFKELRAKMSAEAQQRSRDKARRMAAAMALDELRAALELTQEQLAAVLEIRQAAVSKLERRTDMYVSTLRRFINAMGGRLEIRAVFPDHGAVEITQFSDATAKHELETAAGR